MTMPKQHDPYCPAPRDWWRTCICDLIREVRDDERGTMRDTAHDPSLHDEDCYLVDLPDFPVPQCTCRLRPLIKALLLGPTAATTE